MKTKSVKKKVTGTSGSKVVKDIRDPKEFTKISKGDKVKIQHTVDGVIDGVITMTYLRKEVPTALFVKTNKGQMRIGVSKIESLKIVGSVDPSEAKWENPYPGTGEGTTKKSVSKKKTTVKGGKRPTTKTKTVKAKTSVKKKSVKTQPTTKKKIQKK